MDIDAPARREVAAPQPDGRGRRDALPQRHPGDARPGCSPCTTPPSRRTGSWRGRPTAARRRRASWRSGATAPPTSSPSCRESVRKAPSPDALPGIVDEMALGIDYETLDRILDGLERGLDAAHVAAARAASDAQVRVVREMARRSQHLRELPPWPDLGGVGLT